MIIKNEVPIRTWIPWNPVDTKKIDPITPSDKENGAIIYSVVWSIVNITPNKIVKNRVFVAVFWEFLNLEWWHHVTDAPDESKIIVFTKGTPSGLNGKIKVGGHWAPSSMSDDLLLWMNVQKKERKNITSEAIKRIIPIFRPTFTWFLWNPPFVDSRSVSRHHENDNIRIRLNETNNGFV